MSIQYSIISALIRAEIKEKVSIGVVAFSNELSFLRLSSEKINIAKELLSENGFKVLKDVVRNLEYTVQINQPGYWDREGLLIDAKPFDSIVFSVEYADYLSKYSNNSILFSEPKIIDLDPSKESIQILYEKYVTSKIIKRQNYPEKLFNVVTAKYKNRIEKMFDLGKEVTRDTVPNLITPITIDFSGRNGIDVFAQTLDMEQNTNVISNHINCVFQLKSIYQLNNIEMKDFIIAKEPPKTLLKQHDIWEQIRATKELDYVDISETDRVIAYAESRGVKPLSLFR